MHNEQRIVFKQVMDNGVFHDTSDDETNLLMDRQ